MLLTFLYMSFLLCLVMFASFFLGVGYCEGRGWGGKRSSRTKASISPIRHCPKKISSFEKHYDPHMSFLLSDLKSIMQRGYNADNFQSIHLIK